MNKGQALGHSEYCNWNSKGSVVLMEIMFIFRKFEGYMHSGIGSRSVPIGCQTNRQKCDLIRIF